MKVDGPGPTNRHVKTDYSVDFELHNGARDVFSAPRADFWYRHNQDKSRQGILIVIPCLNEEANLPRLLRQLIAENPQSIIVVADGGSTDASRAIVANFARSFPKLHLIDNPKRLQSAGVNLAVSKFGKDHEWLVRVDAHCGYPGDFVARLVASAGRNAATSVVVPMVTRGDDCFQRAVAAAQNSIIGTGGALHRKNSEGRFVDHGHHALFSLAAFVAAKGYDESFSHNEDAELDARLAANGARIWLEPDAILVYTPRRSPGALFRQYLNYGKGRARTVAKHRLPLKLRQMAPLMVAPAVGLAVVGAGLAALAPLFAALLVPALAWAMLCLTFGLWLGLRDRSACTAMSGVAAMIMHFAWSIGFLSVRLRSPTASPSPSYLRSA
jgi:succinoglycan biosynthesis protein ExoA